VTRLQTGQSEARILPETRDFSLILNAQSSSGVHPAFYTGSTVWWVKWPGHEVDCSPLANAWVKNEWNYDSTPLLHPQSADRNCNVPTVQI